MASPINGNDRIEVTKRRLVIIGGKIAREDEPLGDQERWYIVIT
jgi:hypothetical protein